MAKLSKDNVPTAVFYESLVSADTQSFDAGNYNNIPTKQALRKIVQELMNEELLNQDVFREVDIVSQIVKDFMGGGIFALPGKESVWRFAVYGSPS
jgi:hypothetical protein